MMKKINEMKIVEIVKKIVDMYRIKIYLYIFGVYVIMLNISFETWENNGVEVILENCELWLNEKHIAEQLGHTNLPVIIKRYPSKYRKHRYELVDKPKNHQTEYFCMTV